MKRTSSLSHVIGPMLTFFFDMSADLMLFLGKEALNGIVIHGILTVI